MQHLTSAWKTSDGQIFDNVTRAEQHQARLDLLTLTQEAQGLLPQTMTAWMVRNSDTIIHLLQKQKIPI